MGYGNNLLAPAEDVQFFNIDTLNGKVKSLETKIQNLSTEIKALKADQGSKLKRLLKNAPIFNLDVTRFAAAAVASGAF